jgi:hypothetical protein
VTIFIIAVKDYHFIIPYRRLKITLLLGFIKDKKLSKLFISSVVDFDRA